MRSRKTVMILGAGVMQVPAVRIARARGWRVIVTDADPRSPAAALADVFERVDLKDTDGLLACAGRHRNGLDGVFTAGTDFSTSVAYIAERLGLPGISHATALNATDKDRMRECFRRHGVPSPDHRAYTAADVARMAESSPGLPVVVKPVDNMGARGVVLVERREDLESVARSALALSRAGRVIVEQFVEGPEFSIDALVSGGEIAICGLADRHIFFPPHFVELGHTLPSALGASEQREVIDVFKRGVKALGIDHGAAKGDIFLTERGAVVGEIAARLSGGYMSGWTYPLATGVESTAAALNLAVGLPAGDLRPKKAWTSAERAFISIPGVVDDILGLHDAASVDGVREVFSRVERGSEVRFPRNNVEKCGNVIAAHETRQQAVAAAQKAVSTILIRLRPAVDETAAFLFSSGSCPHPWFSLAPPLRERMNRMAWYAERETISSKNAGLPKIMRMGAFRVMAFPELMELQGSDWNHRGVKESLAVLERLAPREAPSGSVLGGVFWQAFTRGGLQGALWLLDDCARCATETELKQRLDTWKGVPST